MPDLPTLTVTQTQADRMLAAFGAANPANTPTVNYKAWLKQQIIEYVKSYEIAQEDKAYTASRATKLNQIETDLT